MLRANNVKAQQNSERIHILGEKSAAVVNSADAFLKQARRKALAGQSWKDYVRNLKAAATTYDKEPTPVNLQAYEVSLVEACDYFLAKQEDKNQVYKPKEIAARKTLLRAHKDKIKTEKIKAVSMPELDFLDDAPAAEVTPSLTRSVSLSSPSPSKKDSPSSVTTSASTRDNSAAKQEITYTTISSVTVPQGASMPEEEESFSAAFFKSFTRCCRPNTNLPQEPSYTSMKKRT